MPPTINYSFTKKNSIKKEEINAALKVLKSGELSGFMGSAGKQFLGGKFVRKFEKTVENFYGIKYAISVNSWTSGLIAAVGSLEIEPGDEIIVAPWTMCATATAILHWNCIPVFADINKDTFCIDPLEIKKKITSKTRAIISIDIFGFPADIKGIRKVIKGKNIKIISDNAQAPYALNNGKISGTNSDIGGFSFNYHKHINTGEGGVIITNSKKLAERMRLIRNHGEAVIGDNKKIQNNIIGHNFRLGEIEAAIAVEQYKKLKKIIKERQRICRKLTNGLAKLQGLILPIETKEITHNYYIYPIKLDRNIVSDTRAKILNLLKKEGIQGLINSYGAINNLPIFKNKIAYGKKNFPWSLRKKTIKNNDYCKISEELNRDTFFAIEVCLFELSNKDIKLIIQSFKKVWKNIKTK
jgi:perosamine synthetase